MARTAEFVIDFNQNTKTRAGVSSNERKNERQSAVEGMFWDAMKLAGFGEEDL